MRRGGDAGRFRRLVDSAREMIGELFVRASFIVGFPGESEEHFEHLVEFVSALSVDYLGAFAFSAEEGTLAQTLPQQLPPSIAEKIFSHWSVDTGVRTRRQRLLTLEMTEQIEAVAHYRPRVAGRDQASVAIIPYLPSSPLNSRLPSGVEL